MTESAASPTRQGTPSQPEEAASQLKLTNRLTYRQALATLVVALLIGLAGGAVELFLDLSRLRGDVQRDMEASLTLVGGSAAEAAFQLNPTLAEQVVSGLKGSEMIAAVRLSDNFGNVLAESGVTGSVAIEQAGSLARALFRNVVNYSLPLRVSGGGVEETVGNLTVTLSADALAERFYTRAETSLVANIARALAISVALVAIFHFLITSPLLKLALAIGRINPAQPAASLVPTIPRHKKDELGHVTGSLNNLLTAFQKGLDDRDRAQQDLEALTRDLENRVAQRTAELQSKKAEAEQAFHKLDQTHAELDKANKMLLESIGYARRIQTSLLPDKEACGTAVKDLSVIWQPLHMVGGDYFWLERWDNKCLMMVIDCTGHGVPGAFMTMVSASALDRILHDHHLKQPKDVLMALDGMVRTRLRQDRPEADSDDGLEAAVCLWDGDTNTLSFAGAGLPLLYLENGELKQIKGDRAVLGYRSLEAPAEITEHVITPAPNAQFYLFTDGVPDHMGQETARLLGRKRLGQMLSQLEGENMSERLDNLQDELDKWRGEEERRDDMTVIGFIPR